MSLHKRRFSRDEKGVSEVVGTILILLITVIIFSAIFAWVYYIPTPEASVKLQMEGALTPIYDAGVWDGAIINITHQGGEKLYGFKTKVYIRVNQDFELLYTQGTIGWGSNKGDSYGLRDDANWTIGEVWSIVNHSIQPDDRVEVGIIESIKGEVLWSSVILGVGGEYPPLFVQKWFDGDLETIAREDLRGNESFGIFAKIEDKDGDFDSDNDVYVNITILYGKHGCFKMYDNGSMGDETADDGIWSAVYPEFVADDSFDGALAIMTAEDDAGHNTTARLILRTRETTIIYLPPELEINITTPRYGPELLPGSGLQHYQIFNETEWDLRRWEGNATRTFVKGERLVIVIASHFLPDCDLDNKFWLFKAESGLSPQPIVYGGGPMGPNSIPSSTDAFELVDYVGNFYVWEYRWNTSSAGHGYSDGLLEYGHYSLRIRLRSSYYPPPDNLFEVQDFISVTDEEGNVPDYPQVITFLDPDHENPSDTFNFTDTMYVKVVVMSAQPSGFEFGNVKIQDFGGGIQIWAKPGNPPVSEALINNSVSYKFSIDLTEPNFDPWLFGENAYTLRILYLKDNDEEYKVALNRLVTIRGPRWYLDIATVIDDYSHPVFDLKVYSIFFENLVFRWEYYYVESYVPFPGHADPPWGAGPFLSVVYGDLDDDTDLDLVEGIDAGKLFMYRNQGGDGHYWQRREVDDLGTAVTAVDVGYVDQDTMLDIVAGTDTGDLWWYANDNAWTPTFIDNTGSEIKAIKFADMDDDEDDDIVLATGNDIRIYENSAGVFGYVTTTDYFADQDLPGNGTVSGSYTDTQMSDDTYESIEEVNGTAYSISTYLANGEQKAVYDIVVGDYQDTHNNDGTYETLTEELCDQAGVNKWWCLRNASGGAGGHMYNLGNVTSGDDIKLYITSYISDGTEAFDIGWSTDSTPNWPAGWQITRTTKGTDTFDLDAQGFGSGQLYIWIRDSDSSKNDGGSDGQTTTLSIDYLVVEVTTESGETSTLDHVWRIESIGAGGDAYKFFVEAYHTENAELDDFLFQYSDSSGGPWTDMVTVTATSDPDTYTGASLPTTISGNIYIRVIDTDSTDGNLVNDTVYVDHMFIRRYVVTVDYYSIDLGSTVNDIAVGDVDDDGDLDVAAATSSGNVYVRYNDGTGELPTVDTLAASGSVLSVDFAYIDEDDDLDVVAGTDDDKVYWFENDLPQTTWNKTKVADTDGDVYCLRAGDVNGDYWDDIVIGTSTGKTVWYKNEHPGWTSDIVDSRDTIVYDLDIGDVDRGATIERERE